jgi:SRSO17 transposase
VTARGHALIDRELYLPMEWCEDHERRREAHIPESVRFATKPELAVQMLARLQQAQIPIAWVVADTDLRRQPGPAQLVRTAAVFLRAGGPL